MFSMFDGHGGAIAADFSSSNMAEHINYWLERGETDLKVVLRKAFIGLNNSFAKHLYDNFVGMCEIVLFRCGNIWVLVFEVLSHGRISVTV